MWSPTGIYKRRYTDEQKNTYKLSSAMKNYKKRKKKKKKCLEDEKQYMTACTLTIK